MTPAALASFVGFVLLAARAASVGDARLTVETTGPTRVYLTDGAGAPLTPPGALAYHKGDEHHFIIPGRLEIELPPGRYHLSAERGPEHRPVAVDVELRAGERRRVELRPERWTDMNAQGWYSADLHNHRRVEEVPTLLRAEDLNLAPTLADWVWEDSQRGQPPVTSEAIRKLDASPVYLERGVPVSAADDARFFLEWIDREMGLYRTSTGFRSEADRAAMLDFFAKGRAVYERLAR